MTFRPYSTKRPPETDTEIHRWVLTNYIKCGFTSRKVFAAKCGLPYTLIAKLLNGPSGVMAHERRALRRVFFENGPYHRIALLKQELGEIVKIAQRGQAK